MKWASNKTKLARAIATCGANATEEDIKAEYIKIGGLVVGIQNTQTEEVIEAVIVNNPSVTLTEETIAIPVVETVAVEEVKLKKVAKKATKK